MKLSLLLVVILSISCTEKPEKLQPITTVYSARTGEIVAIPEDPNRCIEEMQYHGVSIGVCQDVAW